MIDTVILLAEENASAPGFRLVSLGDASELPQCLDNVRTAVAGGKWSRLRAPAGGVQALEHLRSKGVLVPFGTIASVDIGCVTGANDFFVLTKQDADAHGLSRRSLQPIIARPGHLAGAVVRQADVRRLTEVDRCLLLSLTKKDLEDTKSPLSHYLRRGRQLGIDKHYKCSVRTPWYSVPGVSIPDAFISYMSHRVPRIALNRANLSSTNLVHQVSFLRGHRGQSAAYVAALYSSLAMLSFELEGRSYGGGVLKIETREAEHIDILHLDSTLTRRLREALRTVDALVRIGKHEDASAMIDQCLLSHGVMTEEALAAVRHAWMTQRNRRALRGRTTA